MQYVGGRRRKLQALGACAIAAVGLAAVALTPIRETVASVTDGVLGSGEFDVGETTWQIESNADPNLSPNEWKQTDTGNPETLAVSTPPINPAKPAYAQFALRVKAGSPHHNGTVSITKAAQVTTGVDAAKYRMRVLLIDGDCTSGAFTGAPDTNYIVGDSDNYEDMLSNSSSFPLTGPTESWHEGPTQKLCFEFSLPDTSASDAVNGTSVTVAWTFTAEELTS